MTLKYTWDFYSLQYSPYINAERGRDGGILLCSVVQKGR